jgi:hypothetical protein
MRVRAMGCTAALALAAWWAAPSAFAAATPSEDFYLGECLMTGHELGICGCMAKAFAPFKDAKPELVSAIMRTYLLEGDLFINAARIKQDLPKLGIEATDTEIERSIPAALAGAKCEE